MDHYLFFFLFYFGFSASVAAVAMLWGSHSKITGAGLVWASVPISNVILLLYRIGHIELKHYPLGFAVLDIVLLGAFYLIYKRSLRCQPNRWAAVVAAIHGAMASVNIFGYAFPDFAAPGTYRLTLNLLLVAALLACLAGFIPKSFDEAKGILKLKWMYFKSDLFHRWTALLGVTGITPMPMRSKTIDPKAFDKVCGMKIREARILADLTQKQLGDEMGFSASQIQKFESGANRISASLLYAFAKFFGKDASFFYETVDQELQTKPAKS